MNSCVVSKYEQNIYTFYKKKRNEESQAKKCVLELRSSAGC